MNKYLSDLVDLQVSAQMQSAFGYVGQTVDVLSEQVPLRDGSADLFYAIAGKPTATAVQILDANGKTVRTMIGDVDAGIQRIAWDGRDSQGNKVARKAHVCTHVTNAHPVSRIMLDKTKNTK